MQNKAPTFIDRQKAYARAVILVQLMCLRAMS